MRRPDRRLCRRFATAMLVIVGLFAAVVLGGLRVNSTTSAEPGLYARAPWLDLDRGQLVYACTPLDAWPLAARYQRRVPPIGRFCEDRQLTLLKRVAAIPGDHVVLTAAGVTVNGTPLPDTAPRARDSAARPLPFEPRDLVLGPGQFWITSALPRPTGLDSRYLGPFDRADIAHPTILLWRIPT